MVVEGKVCELTNPTTEPFKVTAKYSINLELVNMLSEQSALLRSATKMEAVIPSILAYLAPHIKSDVDFDDW